jgi:enterochelin esterase-like enzyme
LVQHDLVLDGDRRLARRALVLLPKVPPPGEKLPLLVLLHGLGETGNELLGIHAWGERYGLVSSYERLKHAPLGRTLEKQRYLTDERLATLNASLAKRPFRGLAIACPVTPNPYKLQPAARTLDRYADWLAETLLPAVRKLGPVATDAEHTGLDGCSLGGYVGVEVFLRKPELFGAFGGVQSAFGAPAARQYAERIAQAIRRVGPRAVRIGSSTQDPYRTANEAFSDRLSELGVPHVLGVLPGPHNQPWLREVGTLDMLLWHDRQLRRR